MEKTMYVNLPVENLTNSIEFFSGLGFQFDAQFSDEKAACLVINKMAYVMLLQNTYFEGFTIREIAETDSVAEVIISIAVQDKEEVNQTVREAVALGATTHRDPDDNGFMYSWSFEDLDGHIWEILWMDPNRTKEIIVE